jgi:hypothetical protein
VGAFDLPSVTGVDGALVFGPSQPSAAGPQDGGVISGDVKAKADKEAHGEFESERPGYCSAQDTFYAGHMKEVGRIYQQTFVDTYSKVAFAKLYDRKTPITIVSCRSSTSRR